jgi:aerobic-type carbon monoxide dehydrogenase small subunit (CoxS/CutS family)
MPGLERGAPVHFEFDGERIAARQGETVAMALFAAGHAVVRHSARLGAPRGVFCNMGICYDCLVYIDEVAVRSCMVLVEDGLQVRSWGPEAP